MQLYSIEYDQLTITSVTDGAGNVTNTETRIRKRINDLPLQTMHMYRERMTGLNFASSVQIEVSNDQPRRERRTYQSKGAAAAPVTTTPVKTRQQRINEAARTGDMSAALNLGAK